jgi:hypothetical protein
LNNSLGIKKTNSNEIESINITRLNEEYDAYIQQLKKQIQYAREERKNSELLVKNMEHRITLLQNQEKYVTLQFQNAKQKIEQILINRSKAEDELRKSMLKRKAKNSMNNSYYSNKNRKNIENKGKSNSYKKQSLNNNNYYDEEKEKLKISLIEKLKEDEKERRRIENEIAEIERQEIELLKGFKQDTNNSFNENEDDD